MNLLQKAAVTLANWMPNGYNPPALPRDITRGAIGTGITLYPAGSDYTNITQGYNRNPWIFAIVSKSAKKFSQVPWYHYRIKRNERKTWFEEYMPLTANCRLDTKALTEAKKMRAKSVDQVIVDSPIQQLLAKPNRNDTGASFREQLYGYKLLSGEGNIWFSRPDKNKPPEEMFIIPKANLALVSGGDPWDIAAYKLVFSGKEFVNGKENILMWKFPNYTFDPNGLSHLRGQSPLESALLLLQTSNEGQERLATMNKNQGVAGMVVNESAPQQPDPEKALFMRRQFDSIVNNNDLAGSIAYMTGKMSFMQFGMNAKDLQILEQMDKSIEWFCNVFDYPPGLLTKDQTYENQKQQERTFIYNNIAVASYGLRDELNAKLLPAFGLDRERDVIDCDILGLPELTEDLGATVTALKDAIGLTVDQRLEAMGYDAIGGEEGKMILVPSGYTTLDELNAPIGGNLNNEVALLNGQNPQP